jgi:hypothetical protein
MNHIENHSMINSIYRLNDRNHSVEEIICRPILEIYRKELTTLKDTFFPYSLGVL